MLVSWYQRKRTLWKKFIIGIALVSVMLPSIAVASPAHQPFAGFNASIGVGLEMPNISNEAKASNFVPSVEDLFFTVSRKMTNNKVNGGVRLGYSCIFKDLFLIGLAADAIFGNNNLDFAATIRENGTDLLIELNSNVKLSNQYALLLKFGRQVGNRALLYGLVGPRWGNFSFTINNAFNQNIGQIINTGLSTHTSYYKTGCALGIGTELLLTRCVSFALEYTHTFYLHPKISNEEAPVTSNGVIIPNAAFTRMTKFSAHSNNVMIRLGYYF